MKDEKMTTPIDLESLLESGVDLDEFGEAADYVDPPNGIYDLVVQKGEITSFTRDDGTVIQSIRLTYAIENTVERTDETEPPVANGSLVTQKWNADVESLKRFKLHARKILGVEDLKGANLGQIFETLEGTQWRAAISHREWKMNGKSGVSINYRVLKNG